MNTTEKALQHSYYTARQKGNSKRVWMQGLRLSDAGFAHGTSYRTEYNLESSTITLILDENGDRKVSGRKKGDSVDPIVELFNAKTFEVLGDCNRVRADFYHGKVVISIHKFESKQQERETRLIKNLKKGVLKKGSLCTGIGMAALADYTGLKESGIQSSLEWVVDRESKYLRVGLDNNEAVTHNTTLFESTLEELEPHLLSPVDHIQFSLACTGHGKAGKAKNQNTIAEEHKKDATGIFGLVKIIEAVNPSILVSENVIEAKNSATYILLKLYLDTLGYNIHEKTLDNDQSGSFENRTRYWFVAVSKGLKDFDIDTIQTYEPTIKTMADIMEDEHTWADNTYLKEKAIRDEKAGKGFKRNLITPESTSVNTIGRHYQKKRSCEPMLVREDGKEALLSVTEVAKVKSCPVSLVKGVVAITAYEGLGQGIDFNQGRGIAHALGCYLKQLLPLKKLVRNVKRSVEIKPQLIKAEYKATDQLLLAL